MQHVFGGEAFGRKEGKEEELHNKEEKQTQTQKGKTGHS